MLAKTFQIRGPITTATQSVYIERSQDREVVNYLQGANYVTILGARQTGKTSLLYHLIDNLPSQIYIPVLIDLSPIRDANKAQLYHFVSGRIAAQLSLDEPLASDPGSSLSQIEFQNFLKRAAEKTIPSSRILVMLDEFEAVPADLREGFFGTIRTVYNERGIQQGFEQYLFLLAGATDPNSLISPESGLSPFNISQKVYLEDFELEGVQEMVQYLEIPNPAMEKSLAAALFAQTHGHPNLSAKLCVFIKDHPGISIEAAVEAFSRAGDENIHRVLEGLQNHPEDGQWVGKLIQGEHTPKFDRSSAMVARLELLGVIRRGGDGMCAIRNQIYQNIICNQLDLGDHGVTGARAVATGVGAGGEALAGPFSGTKRLFYIGLGLGLALGLCFLLYFFFASVGPSSEVLSGDPSSAGLPENAGQQGVDSTVFISPESVEIFPRVSGPFILSDLQVADIFASFYPSYAHRPLGWVQVGNTSSDTSEAVLHFYLPEGLGPPVEERLVLAPQTTQRVALKVRLDPTILALKQRRPAQVNAVLSFIQKGGVEQLQTTQQTTIYGRGLLRWDEVARGAAFITSQDPAVAAFSRPPLVAFEPQIESLGVPCQNLLRAMVLFEALKQHGIRYIADANTPYVKLGKDQVAIDHIQYPAEVLQHKSGDCDDLTVLYCSLLENAGIATALVDYPKHIFLMFDSGISHEEAYKLPLNEKNYLARGEKLWIGLETTRLDQTFIQAWQTGMEQLATLSSFERRRRVVDTAVAWQQYPATTPAFEIDVVPPEGADFASAFGQQDRALRQMIEAHTNETYLVPLKLAPENTALWTRLLKMYLALHQFDRAISTAQERLLDERGDKGRTYNALGIAHYIKGEVEQVEEETTQAAIYFKEATKLRPGDKDIQRNLGRALEALGRTTSAKQPIDEFAAADSLKAGATRVEVESFYWVQ